MKCSLTYPVLCAAAITLLSCGGGSSDETKEVVLAATNGVRGQLKVPGSARFSQMPDTTTERKSGDTLLMESDSIQVAIFAGKAFVSGFYEAQNTFGVYLPGTYTALLKKDSATGTWTGLTGDESIDFNLKK